MHVGFHICQTELDSVDDGREEVLSAHQIYEASNNESLDNSHARVTKADLHSFFTLSHIHILNNMQCCRIDV